MNSPGPADQTASTRAGPIHTLPVGAVYTELASDPRGLTQAEAEARLRRYGRNTIRTLKAQSLTRKCLANFTHLMALLLWAGGLLGFIAGAPELGAAIWTVNLINGL